MPNLDLARLAPAEFARAASTAFVADVARSPSLEKAITDRSISKDGLKNLILGDLARGVSGSPGPVLFPNMRELVQTEVKVGEHRLSVGLSQFDFGGLIGAVAGIAAGAINYSAAASTQRAQLQSQQLSIQMAQIQADTARLQLAAQQGLPGTVAGTPGASIVPPEVASFVSSTPVVTILAALAGGGIMYALSRSR
jgi:hypothetical protein